MATISLGSLPLAPSLPVHLLPCTVQHDGPAKVSSYFVISPEHTTAAEVTPVPRKEEKKGLEKEDSGFFDSGDAETDAALKNPETILETTFRGRQLKGRTLILPEGYRGW
jgi:hypothetical protein